MIKPRALSKTEVFKRWTHEIVPLLKEVIASVNADWTEDDIEVSINKETAVSCKVSTKTKISKP